MVVSSGRWRRLKPYAYVLPMLLFAAVFVYYPFIRTLGDSFHWVDFQGRLTGFAGLDNYRYLFGRREFSIAMANTLKLTLINVPVTIALTLLLAWMTARRTRLSPLTETLLALPMAVSMPTVALIFKVLLNPTVGWLNAALGLQIGWFQDRHTAMSGVLMMTVWMGIGFNYLLFLGAFRGINRDVIDSAAMDGASRLRTLFSIQLPLVSPTMLFVLCTNMVQALMTSGPMLIVTEGGPSRSTTTLIYLMYTSGYRSSNYAVAAAISMVTFVLALGFTVVIFMSERKRVHYQ